MSTDKRPIAGAIPADQLDTTPQYFGEYEIYSNGKAQYIDGTALYLDSTSEADALEAFAAWQGYNSIEALTRATGNTYTAAEVHQYEIEANDVHMGIFYGATEADALERYATEAGYKSFAALQAEQPAHVTIHPIGQYL